jgi:actin-like ATPase involved in cell morphogenesis
MDDANEQVGKGAQDTGTHFNDAVKSISAPLGVDVGTSKVLVAARRGKEVETHAQLNAFLTVPVSAMTEATLQQNAVPFYRQANEIAIHGSAAERFAHVFNAEMRRPMSDGVLNPRETMATQVLERILSSIVPRARSERDVLAFSVPASAEGRASEVTYHEGTLRRFFQSLGYKAVAVNEGMAVVFSELQDTSFTGIGISCGGGMCNAALSYLSIPSLMFSIPKGGDAIDSAAGKVVGEPATRVKAIKEESLDLTREPTDKLDKALHIYYEDLIESLVDALHRAVTRAEKRPRADRPLPIVLAGGTASPKGFREMFEASLKKRPLPFDVAGIRVAQDPITATARGALIAARYEK